MKIFREGVVGGGMRGRTILFLALAVALLLLAGWSMLVEPRWLRVVHRDAAPPSGHAVVIAQLTDFHIKDQGDLCHLERAVREVERIRPDLVVLTGDYVVRRLAYPREYRELLRRLVRVAPTCAVAGNHDGGTWVSRIGGYATTDEMAAFLRGAGVRFLENRTETFLFRGRKVEVFGAGDPWAGNLPRDPTSAFSRDSAALKVVLIHNPDMRPLFDGCDWKLMLCGHTHGGQVVLPFIGAPWAPVRDKRYVKGLFPMDGGKRFLVVSPGVGSPHGLRLFCRPEVTVVRV